MAVLAGTNLTIADWTKRRDPSGKPAMIAEILSQDNEHLEDMVLKEGSLPFGDLVTYRTGYPTVYYRAINSGVPSSKSTTAQTTEAMSFLESRSVVDCKLARAGGNPDQLRSTEVVAFIEAMGQEQASGIFYNNPVTDPKRYLGLSARYSLKAGGNGQNILDAGGTSGQLASVWFIGWGDQACYMHFPKGLQGGLQHQNLGEQMMQLSDGTMYQAFVDLFTWDIGLGLANWANVVRICNISISDLLAGTGTQASSAATWLPKLMQRAIYRVKKGGAARFSFNMNRTVHSLLTVQGAMFSANAVKFTEGINQFGHPMQWASFQGFPMRIVDALTNGETQVT